MGIPCGVGQVLFWEGKIEIPGGNAKPQLLNLWATLYTTDFVHGSRNGPSPRAWYIVASDASTLTKRDSSLVAAPKGQSRLHKSPAQEGAGDIDLVLYCVGCHAADLADHVCCRGHLQL